MTHSPLSRIMRKPWARVSPHAVVALTCAWELGAERRRGMEGAGPSAPPILRPTDGSYGSIPSGIINTRGSQAGAEHPK